MPPDPPTVFTVPRFLTKNVQLHVSVFFLSGVCRYAFFYLSLPYFLQTKSLTCDMMVHADVANLAVTGDKTHLVALLDCKVTQTIVFIKLQL